MKKLLTLTAIATLATTAHADLKVYGIAGAILNYSDTDYKANKVVLKADGTVDTSAGHTKGNKGKTELQSFRTRFGVKGTESLTQNTDLLYQLEYALDIDDGSKTQFRSRDTFIGLNNKKYGELKAGRISTIDGDVDYAFQNYTLVYDNDYGGSTWNGLRLNNSLVYHTPNYKGLTLGAQYAMDENATTDAGLKVAEAYGMPKVTGSVGIVNALYEPTNKPYKAGVAYVQSGEFNSARVSAGYDITKDTKVGALYQVSDSGVSSNPKETLIAIGGSYKTATPWTVYGEAAWIKDMKFTKGTDSQQYVVGANYAFNPATKALVYVGHQTVDAKSTADEYDVMNVGAGLTYAF